MFITAFSMPGAKLSRRMTQPVLLIAIAIPAWLPLLLFLLSLFLLLSLVLHWPCRLPAFLDSRAFWLGRGRSWPTNFFVPPWR